jgi:ABC-type branched-subunit amino acid transport system substrate-binding protein
LIGFALMSLALAGCELVPHENPARAAVADQSRRAEALSVALLVPLSGENALLGQSIANAAGMAVAEEGEGQIRITTYDTARGSISAASAALAAGNEMILGPLRAEDVRAISAVARNAQVPVVAFSNDARVAADGVYLLGLDPTQSIERVVGYARSRALQRFAVLAPTGEDGARSVAATVAAVEATGGRIIGTETYDLAPASIRAAVARLSGRGEYDAVLIADTAAIASVAAQELRSGPTGAQILGTSVWSADADLGTKPALRGAWFAAPSNAAFEAFAGRYQERFGTRPSRLAALGYDAALVALRAARGAGPEAALRSLQGFTGIDGPLRFGTNRIAERELNVERVIEGGIETLSAGGA